MAEPEFDLAIVGAGSGGLVAAGFAARLGARVALIEKNRIGGDCTWTGCVPSKALLKVARVAHAMRTASRFGIAAQAPIVDMTAVRQYVRDAIEQVYRLESPKELRKRGIETIEGAARFVDAGAVMVGERQIRAKKFLIATGAHPYIPPIAGLSAVPFLTYERIFDAGRLPRSMAVVGGGPVGMEMAQAWRRLGVEVSVVAERLLPKEEPESRELMQRVFEREGIGFVWGRATSARKAGEELIVQTGEGGEARGELLLIAAGRRPTVAGLDLENAGVNYSERGIAVDDRLRTNVKHIFAAGDVTGGYQFTHFAGWQAFQAARNALLPGSASGFTGLVPRVTFTDPEVAHAGMTEEQARTAFGDKVKICRKEMSDIDRAICEDDREGFIKVIAKPDGAIVGAAIVSARAGEAIAEFVVAMKQDMKDADLAGAIHPYPTYSTPAQQIAADLTIERTLAGATGMVIRGLSSIVR